MCACMYAICMWPWGWRSFFFHLPVKCFTLAVAWKGSLIEKHSGRGICHPPRCSVTTLIHAPPDQNQEARHSTSQQEGGSLHSRGAGKEEERKGKQKDQTRPALINSPMNLQASVTYLLLFNSITQSHTCLHWDFHLYVGGSDPRMSVNKLFLACT